MTELLHKYSNSGSFIFYGDDNLKIKTKDVPNLPGIYLIYALKDSTRDLVYIGKSGTYRSSGNFSNQLLKKRLNNIQDGVKRQIYFSQKITAEHLDKIEVEWYVTFDNSVKDLPGFVEGKLVQNYYDTYQSLPKWNKEF